MSLNLIRFRQYLNSEICRKFSWYSEMKNIYERLECGVKLYNDQKSSRDTISLGLNPGQASSSIELEHITNLYDMFDRKCAISRKIIKKMS